MSYAKSFKEKSLNQQDLFNECVVTFSLYWKFLYKF